jgi:hypothetical protein
MIQGISGEGGIKGQDHDVLVSGGVLARRRPDTFAKRRLEGNFTRFRDGFRDQRD